MNTMKNRIGKLKLFIFKYKWLITFLIVVLAVSYPFLFLFINKTTGLNMGELYTFGLPLKDFITPWIAFWGVFGAAINIWLMQRRVSIMEKQRDDQQKNIENQEVKQKELRIDQQKQFETQIEKQNELILIQQKQLRDSRFASGIELLGSPNESVRTGGAYNLYFLASEFSDDYLDPVCEILCSHVRSITKEDNYREKFKEKPSNEIQTILNLLFIKNKNDILIFDKCDKNLTGVFLCGSTLNFPKLRNVNFFEAILENVYFLEASLVNVSFTKASLYSVNFPVCTFKNVQFDKANLESVVFANCKLSDVDFFDSNLICLNFFEAELNKTLFLDAKLIKINFSNAKMNSDNVNFFLTKLEKISFEEITRPGRSIELTTSTSK